MLVIGDWGEAVGGESLTAASLLISDSPQKPECCFNDTSNRRSCTTRNLPGRCVDRANNRRRHDRVLASGTQL